ncbi:MAG: SseB family protein [Lactimicrobium sp.]|jgi:hypothetical protein|uniref:SseB family protein n=1 Tax=Lactimicrobium sp. TaxID=2563780 RepID=UPI002F35C087
MDQKQEKIDQKDLARAEELNVPVQQAISAYYHDRSQKNVAVILQSLTRAVLLVPGVQKEEGPANGVKVSFSIIKDGSGKPYFAAFTSVKQLAAWSPEKAKTQAFLPVDFTRMAQILEENPVIGGFMINVKSQPFLMPARLYIQAYHALMNRLKGMA